MTPLTISILLVLVLLDLTMHALLHARYLTRDNLSDRRQKEEILQAQRRYRKAAEARCTDVIRVLALYQVNTTAALWAADYVSRDQAHDDPGVEESLRRAVEGARVSDSLRALDDAPVKESAVTLFNRHLRSFTSAFADVYVTDLRPDGTGTLCIIDTDEGVARPTYHEFDNLLEVVFKLKKSKEDYEIPTSD